MLFTLAPFVIRTDFVLAGQEPRPFSWVALNLPPFTEHLDVDKVTTLQDTDDNLVGSVQIRNLLKYSARNPGLRIEFDGLLFNPTKSSGWAVVERWHPVFNGAKAIQWDGGTENIIHGQWTRTLPDLNLGKVLIFRFQPPPAFIVTVVADGCSPRTGRMELHLDKPVRKK
jgi:hypothetical protein